VQPLHGIPVVVKETVLRNAALLPFLHDAPQKIQRASDPGWRDRTASPDIPVGCFDGRSATPTGDSGSEQAPDATPLPARTYGAAARLIWILVAHGGLLCYRATEDRFALLLMPSLFLRYFAIFSTHPPFRRHLATSITRYAPNSSGASLACLDPLGIAIFAIFATFAGA
jgi:hypothetical protein